MPERGSSYSLTRRELLQRAILGTAALLLPAACSPQPEPIQPAPIGPEGPKPVPAPRPPEPTVTPVLAAPATLGPSIITSTMAADKVTPRGRRFGEQVQSLDQLIVQSQTTEELRKWIQDLTIITIEYFRGYFGYTAERFGPGLFFQNHRDFLRDHPLADPYKNSTTDGTVAGVTDAETGQIFIDRTLPFDPRSKSQYHPAYGLIFILLHEFHHSAAPLKRHDPPLKWREELIGEEVICDYQRGLNSFLRCKNPQSEGQPRCTERLIVDDRAEETVVRDSVQWMVEEAGLNTEDYITLGTAPKEWLKRYRHDIVQGLFKGDHRKLLLLQQSTEPERFFKAIGAKMDPRPEFHRAAGKRYLSLLFTDQS